MITPLSEIDEISRKGICPLCGGATKYLSTDLRPVFPAERLLLELLIGERPLSLSQKSVWCQDSRYYINGKSKSIPSRIFLEADTEALSEKLKELKSENESEETDRRFENQIERFIKANRPRLNFLKDEACEFIKKEASKFPSENIVISFSGGKDSSGYRNKSTFKSKPCPHIWKYDTGVSKHIGICGTIQTESSICNF